MASMSLISWGKGSFSLFVSMMDALGELQSVSSEAPVATAVKYVQDMNVETNLAFCVGAFGPRHATSQSQPPVGF